MNLMTISTFMTLAFLGGIALWLYHRRRLLGHQSLSLLIDALSIPHYRKALPGLNRELSRARRFQRPLTVLVIRPLPGVALPGSPSGNGVPTAKPLNQLDFLLTGTILRDSIREIDMLVYDGLQHQYIILLPETTREGARHTVNRLLEMGGDRVRGKTTIGIAEFPADGLIIEDLLQNAGTTIKPATVTGN